MTSLRRLTLAVNAVTDVSGIAGLPELRNLDVRENPGLTSVEAVSTLPLLGQFAAGGAGQTLDLSGLAGREVLRSITYTNAGATSLAVVADLPTLEVIDLTGTPVSAANVDEIAAGTRLQRLGLASTGVDDLSALAVLTDMESIDLEATDVRNVEFAAGWLRLTSMDLRDSAVRRLEGLELQENLVEVDARGSALQDVNGLANNETFRANDRLRARDTALDADDCTDILVILSRDGVVESDVDCG